MKTKEIKQLLEAYYEGNCNTEDEKTLIQYFSREDIDEELKEEQVIFNSIHSIDEIPENAELESKLSSLIDDLSQKENNQQATAYQNNTNKKRSRLIFWISGVAASLALLLSIGLMYFKDHQYLPSSSIALKDTYSDPEQAYAETEKVLLLISSKLNIGISSMDAIQEGFDKSNEIIDKNLKQINIK